MAQESCDCIVCVRCKKPNFIVINNDNEARYNSIIRWKWLAYCLPSILWIPIVIAIAIVWEPSLREPILKNVGWVVLFLFMLFPFVRFTIPKEQHKKLMWKYGEIAKSTYKEIKC